MLRCLTAQPEERGLQGEHGNSRAPALLPQLRESARPRAGAQPGRARSEPCSCQPALPVPRAEPAPGVVYRAALGTGAGFSLRSIFLIPRWEENPNQPHSLPHSPLKVPLPGQRVPLWHESGRFGKGKHSPAGQRESLDVGPTVFQGVFPSANLEVPFANAS